MDRRSDLVAWIDQTTRLQRRLTIGLAVVAAVVIATRLGTLAYLSLAIVALGSLWVTAAHKAEWRRRLSQLRSSPARSRRA